MFSRIGIVVNPDRVGAADAAAQLLALLGDAMPGSACRITPTIEFGTGKKGHAGDVVSDSLENIAKNSDVIFSFGGDGTMLGVARAIVRSNSGASLVGINLGKLGFIAENQPEDMEVLVQELANARLRPEPRLLVQAHVRSEDNREGGTRLRHYPNNDGSHSTSTTTRDMLAMNEIVVDNFGSTRMLTFELRIDGTLAGTMRADGIIVASPTGSTGYAVSAGGPIIEPTSEVLLITPIAPHSLNVRPIVVPQHVRITVRASSDETTEALFVADGQEEVVVGMPALAEIGAARERVTLLRRESSNYFDRLRNKLLWSIDARDGGGRG